MRKIYFDTNIYNKIILMKKPEKVFEKMKEYNHILCVSEVNIFEILRNQSESRELDKMISVIQQANKINKVIILPSVQDILINYLSNDNMVLTKSKIISDVVNDENKEFKIKKDDVKKLTNNFKNFCKVFRKKLKTYFLVKVVLDV